jgi:hypothetical protein
MVYGVAPGFYNLGQNALVSRRICIARLGESANMHSTRASIFATRAGRRSRGRASISGQGVDLGAGRRSRGRASISGQGRASISGQGRASISGQGRASISGQQGRAGRRSRGRAGQGRAGRHLSCCMLHAGQGVTYQHAGQGRAGQGRAGQGRAGQGRAGQGRAGQGVRRRLSRPKPLESLRFRGGAPSSTGTAGCNGQSRNATDSPMLEECFCAGLPVSAGLRA